ncbi:MAG: acetoin utilization protein AcuC [Steroidobacteraceae bacterium]|jgi:acetoin utilization protein AcuC|nr:acetoin utilization protein AcuC [Steroidobacteraceae bacterium]
MSSDVLVIAGEKLARYGFGEGHPFGPDRHGAFYREFEARGLHRKVEVEETRAATEQELLAFHTPELVAKVRDKSSVGQGYLDGGDTPAYRGVFEAASYVVGGTLKAADAIMSGKARRGFVPIAGLHHAGRGHAAGFCVFNDCGVAIELLRSRHGLRRIAYVDIDAHHGDGVFYAFESDPQLIFADLHEDGRFLYPGTGSPEETGKGAAAGTKVNVALAPGSDDSAFEAHWPRILAHLEAHAPEFILLQCGADSIEGDPITHLRFSPRTHGRAARDLVALAERLGHGRVLATGGGGYNRSNLAQAWNEVVAGLIG